MPDTTDPGLFLCMQCCVDVAVCGGIIERAIKHSADRWQHWDTWDQCSVCPKDDEAIEESGH